MNIEAVIRKHEKQLLILPNVTGVGVGERKARQVILVFVSQKVPESGLKPQDRVPKTFEGFETDVQLRIAVGNSISLRGTVSGEPNRWRNRRSSKKGRSGSVMRRFEDGDS